MQWPLHKKFDASDIEEQKPSLFLQSAVNHANSCAVEIRLRTVMVATRAFIGKITVAPGKSRFLQYISDG
jgi:hypothetical protein